MDVVAQKRSAATTGWESGIVHIHYSAHSRDATAGPRAAGYASRKPGAGQFGKQRLVVPWRFLVGIGLRPQAAPLHEPCDAPANAVRDADDVSVTGWKNVPDIIRRYCGPKRE